MFRKNKIIIIIVAIIILAGVYIYNKPFFDPDLQYSQEYIVDTGNIKGNVNTEYFTDKSADFEIGANQYGFAVFKKPDAAFARLKAEYKAGINLIKREFKLLPLFHYNYEGYGAYGWQVSTGTKEEREQASFISCFMDIYENSFQKR